MSKSNNKKRSRADLSEDDEENVDALEKSNIAHLQPKKYMKLEVRDADYIWSSGFIQDVKQTSSGRTQVCIASDGWGSQWDEVMDWPNDRLSRLYTYTKEVKCLIELLPKRRSRKPSKEELDKLPKGAKSVYCSLWPIKVQFRMPHPNIRWARDSLREEDKVFFRPYGVKYLPTEVQKIISMDQGCWFSHSKLRKWTDEPEMLGVLHPNFMLAYKEALQDKSIKGFLLQSALEEKSLLRDIYRVHDIRGCTDFDGVLRETTPPPKKNVQEYDLAPDDEDERDLKAEGVVPPGKEPPSVVAVRKDVVEDHAAKAPDNHDAPKLPPPIQINDPLYYRAGVSKCTETNEWVASLSRNHNQVFLGKFPTESQAWTATRKATGDHSLDMPVTPLDAQHTDLQAVSMESIIDAYESQYDAGVHTFSLHDWVLGKIHHHCYLKEKTNDSDAQRSAESAIAALQQVHKERKSKRKGHPRRYVRTK